MQGINTIEVLNLKLILQICTNNRVNLKMFMLHELTAVNEFADMKCLHDEFCTESCEFLEGSHYEASQTYLTRGFSYKQ